MKKLLYIVLLGLPVGVMAQETGSYQGIGTGTGSGKDINKEFLPGREVAERPITPALTCADRGTIVLAITVDRAGKVLDAEAARGSTTTAQCLVDYAKSIALATKFSAKEDAPEKQTGTMTFYFKETE